MILLGMDNRVELLERNLPGATLGSFYLRNTQFDRDIYEALVKQQEYNYIRFLKEPDIIIDAGANIGLASVLYAIQFPSAKIYAIEPAPDNFELLQLNLEKYPNIHPINCAIMDSDGKGTLVDYTGSTLGYQVEISKKQGTVQCYSLDTICKKFGIDHINLLKMDVEGAEASIFKTDNRWITNVDVLIVELHERYVKGCNNVVFSAVRNSFDIEWIGGENFYFAHLDYALPRVPDVYKCIDPMPLPIEKSWEYRDHYDALYATICKTKDDEISGLQALNNDLIQIRDSLELENKLLVETREAKDLSLKEQDTEIIKLRNAVS